jgi:SAM-dependent methyltransferase
MNSSSNSIRAEDFEFAALNAANNYRAAILSNFRTPLCGNVIEVGAGIGQITDRLRKSPEIQNLTSIEPDAGFCAQIRERFPDIDLVHGTISDLQTKRNWNSILSINVLEHIETDEKELAIYHRLLKPANGALCLFVPARPEIYAPIDRDFGHYRRYTRPELTQKLERAGFKIQKLRYFNLVGYFGWWATFCLLKKRSFDIHAVGLFDRMIFPVVHWTESHVCAPPFGQSLIAIATAS